MKKRFALAVSLISNPPNIVFDEVLNGLDPQGIAFFRELTHEFKRENKAVLFSSHILKEVGQLADKVVFIHKGRIIGIYTVEEITRLAKPSLKIRVSSNLEEAVKILSNYGEVVAGDMEATIKINHGVSPEEIVGELVKRNIGVKEFRSEERDLETFFFELIKEAEKQ